MTHTISPLDRLAQQADQLYSLPAVALEVVRLTSLPQVDPRQIKLCLESDPALAARILKVVNSSLFGLSRQVTDLQQALALLGLKPLKALMLGFSLPPQLLQGIHAEALQKYWQHTLLKALACRLLEQHVAPSDDEEAFMAGLLQDVGVLALLQQLGENYASLYLQMLPRSGEFLTAELTTLGFDHLALSARMLTNWRLPTKLCQAIAVHPNELAVGHAPPQCEMLCQILHLSELLARYVEQPHDAELASLLEIGERYFELGPVRLHSLLTELTPHFESLANVLALELPSGPTSNELLLAAHRRLASITSEMIPELLQSRRAADDVAALETILLTTKDLQRAVQGTLQGGVDPLHPDRNPASVLDLSPAPTTTPKPSQRKTATPVAAASAAPHRVAADPGFLGRVAVVLQACRQQRTPLSLALLQLDHFAELQFGAGFDAGLRFLERFRRHLAEATGGLGPCVRLDDTHFGLLWSDCSRSEAISTLRNVQQALPDWQDACLPADALRLTLSAGVATISLPSRNFPPAELVTAAERCLDGVVHSGGNSIKSIEL
jgi:HD-like signal output (HDOD) protein/GGDEF domain-containing protein